MAADQLRWQGGMRLASAQSMKELMQRIGASLSEVRFPMLVVASAADEITPPDGSERLVRLATTAEELKSVRVLEGPLHDLTNDPDSAQMRGIVVDWLAARAAAPVL